MTLCVAVFVCAWQREWEKEVRDVECVPEVSVLVYCANTSAQTPILRGTSQASNLSAMTPV